MANEVINVCVSCVGITPYLQNRMPEEDLMKLWKGSEGKRAKTAPREDMRTEAAKRVYIDKTQNDRPYVPAEQLMKCLINAGQQIRLDGKRQISTATSTLLPLFLTLQSLSLPIYDPTDKTKKTWKNWELDIRKGTNPNGGEAVCIVRPRFDVWAFDAHVLIDTRQIAEPVMRDLFDRAGMSVGVGDFRPQKKGTMGQFKVACWHVEGRSTNEVAAE